MYVAPAQLIPGCVLLEEVKGKTNRVIIPKNIELTRTHITVLEKFLVKSVNVSSKLADGTPFTPATVLEDKKNQLVHTSENPQEEPLLFIDHYQLVVEGYKWEFKKWQTGWKLDMPAIRRLVMPLLKRVPEIGGAVFMLHQYTSKQDYLFEHAVAVGLLCAYVGKKMGFEKGEWLQIGLAGLLSDCGMAKIDKAILTKTSTLTDGEYREIKRHPTYSYHFVEDIRTITQPVKLAVIQHHERIDGSGYPLGITKDTIHMYARIVAVCDTFHAMANRRMYQEKLAPFKVIAAIQKEQYAAFDPQVVHIFIKSFTAFMIGTKVRLSNDQIGEVVFIDPNKPTRPMIKIHDKDEMITLDSPTGLLIDEIFIDSRF